MDNRLELKAAQLMYGGIHHYLTEGSYGDSIITTDLTSYTIVWLSDDFGNPAKVCIQYDNSFKEKKELCAKLQ